MIAYSYLGLVPSISVTKFATLLVTVETYGYGVLLSIWPIFIIRPDFVGTSYSGKSGFTVLLVVHFSGLMSLS